MNTTMMTDEHEQSLNEKPGAQLAAARLLKGLSVDYVANKLHLREQIIELLEADAYHKMPEPVFIKGYLRAYARLVDMPSEPLLATFNQLYVPEKKLEKAALWQSRRETNKAEHAVRWLTGIFALVVIGAVAMWWHSNKENEHLFSANVSRTEPVKNQSETEIRLTDLSKMRSLLSSAGQNSSSLETESQDG